MPRLSGKTLDDEFIVYGKSETIADVCLSIECGDLVAAEAQLRLEYPFAKRPVSQRKYSDAQAMRVFTRDGFVDRYSGDRLVFPGVLRIISLNLPHEFPFQKNWKMDETHMAFWELMPTVDHVIPVARGGVDSEENWVTTSMVRNSAKSNWLVEELGWSVRTVGGEGSWDGLLTWFFRYVGSHEDLLKEAYVRRWFRAARQVAVV